MNINSLKGEKNVSGLLYGACLEDVNHELYGGIWSQMIYGERFAEPEQTAYDNFDVYGGSWTSKDNILSVKRMDQTGPKFMLNGSGMSSGWAEAMVKFEGEGPAGFIIKVSDPKTGADNFNGYEIGVGDNMLRIGNHRYNYTNMGDYPCSAPAGEWAKLRVEMSENSVTVYVNDAKVTEFNDASFGEIGLRAWNCDAQFKDISYCVNGGQQADVEIPDSSGGVSGMWSPVETGTAQGGFKVEDESYMEGEKSQSIEFVSGEGSVGISNMSLNRKGMNFEKDKPDEETPGGNNPGDNDPSGNNPNGGGANQPSDSGENTASVSDDTDLSWNEEDADDDFSAEIEENEQTGSDSGSNDKSNSGKAGGVKNPVTGERLPRLALIGLACGALLAGAAVLINKLRIKHE